jgi:membrane-associated phospholipid phosphatase
VSPIFAALSVSVPPAGVGYLLARRWPHRDPGAPQLKPQNLAGTVRRYPRIRSLIRSRLDPARDTGLLLTAALAGVVVSLSTVGVLIRMVRSNSGLVSYDAAFARWGSQHADASSTKALKLLSVLGGYQFLVVACVAVAAMEYRRGKGKAVIALLLLVVGGQFAVANAVKLIVGRARPDLAQLTGFSGSSFPSGHAAAAVASFSAFSLLLGRARSAKVKAAFVAITLGVSVGVAASRVLLGVHWFTDVLGGMAIGWIWFAVSSIAFGGRILRFGLPIARVEAAAGAAVSLPGDTPLSAGSGSTQTADARGAPLVSDLQKAPSAATVSRSAAVQSDEAETHKVQRDA